MNRALFATAVAACALFLTPGQSRPAAAADGAASILAKHKAYMGWTYGDGSLKSVRQTIKSEAPSPAPTPKPNATPDPLGNADTASTEVRRELLYRATSTAYGIDTSASGFTGSVFWRSNANGQTVTRRGRDARTALTETVIEAEAFAEVPVSARPAAQFDGKSAEVVRVEPKTGEPADVYFGADGAMLGYVLLPDVPVERTTVHVVSYAEFAPGKRYVSAFRLGDSKRIFKITKFEANAAVTDADLHPPAVRATWTFGEPRSVPVSVVSHTSVYSNSGARAVHVDVLVNGHLGRFLVDSGAGGTLIYDPFATKAGIKDLGRTYYTGVSGGVVGATFARVDTLQIGGNTLHDVIVDHGKKFAEGIDGIIGFDVLANAVVDVDLTKNRLTISDPNGFDMPLKQGAYAFQVDLSDFHAGVPMKVQSSVLPSVWLDTGDDYFLILPHELERKTVALANTINVGGLVEFEQTMYFGGVDGAGGEPARCVRLNEVQVGPYRYQKALSCFAPNDAFGLDGGLIGFDFLRHFNWTFDYPHGRVVLTPNGL
ncbi:MAG TPA: retropepsin-like aspartic protease [Candidatus Elarobacter sp.]|nr:retropepsin-like aspartic protease [Candidatus Elarobacter sp.]